MSATLIGTSHGTDDPAGQAAVRALLDGVRAARPGLDVREAFVDVQQPEVGDVLADVMCGAGRRQAEASTGVGESAGPGPGPDSGRRDVEAAKAGQAGVSPGSRAEAPDGGPVAVVVPLLLSTGYHVRHDIAQAVTAANASASAVGPGGVDGSVVGPGVADVSVAGSGAVNASAVGSGVADTSAAGSGATGPEAVAPAPGPEATGPETPGPGAPGPSPARSTSASRPAVAADPLGPHPLLVDILADRFAAAEAAHGPFRPEDAVVLAAAGSSVAAAATAVEEVASGLAQRLGRVVTPSYGAGAEPRVPAAVAAARAGSPGTARVIVVSYLLAPGYFLDRVLEAGADVVTDPVAGVPGARKADPRLVQVVLDRYDAAVRT